MLMRDRRGMTGRPTADDNDGDDPAAALRMPLQSAREREAWRQKRMLTSRRKGYLYYMAFVALFLGLPLFIIIRATPFFVFEQLRCRAADRLLLWGGGGDTTAAAHVRTMEAGYEAFFSAPPLFPSEAYNQTVHWGTYDPSRIFAMRTRSADRPITVGLAWYDEARAVSLRHGMAHLHNKVAAPRSSSPKAGADLEVVQIRWIVHDGLHYGKQTIIDAGNRANFDVEFLKGPSGRSWHVRVQAVVATASPLNVVLYVLNGDTAEPVVVEQPDGHNDGDWSPTLNGRMADHCGESRAFALRVHDRHNPLFDTNPWRVYGRHAEDPAATFALTADDFVGGTVAERAAADGRGFGRVAEQLAEGLDLRDLPDDGTTFTYIASADQTTFRTPYDDDEDNTDKDDDRNSSAGGATGGHNLIILKKAYSTDFRLEISLSPAEEKGEKQQQQQEKKKRAPGQTTAPVGLITPQYDALPTCALANAFRRREKRVYAHAKKIFKPMVHKRFNVSGGLYENIAAQTLGETFASVSYSGGRYHVVSDREALAAWDAAGTLPAGLLTSSSPDLVHPSSHVASAVAAVGSRTDEPYGQQFLTGLQLLFIGRWNKEMVKDAVASWLLGAQDPATGFIPARATFTDAVRSLAPRGLRAEAATVGSPPALLLGLQELLNEMERKAARVAARKASGGYGNRRTPKERNSAAYLKAEQASDRAFLESILPSLRQWRSWWHSSQCGGPTEALAMSCSQVGEEVQHRRRPLESWSTHPTGRPEDELSYRWRGRDGARLPASGMEDYPRPVCPGSGEHLLAAHVDLFSWVALLSSVISRIETTHLGHASASVAVDWEAHLNAVHWDTVQGRYADRVGCTARGFSPYVGYASLFPVMLGVVREDLARVAATVTLAKDQLLAEFGLMSVSYESVARAREDGLAHSNLWMGMVWPSHNVMFLHALKSTYAGLFANASTNTSVNATAAAAAGREVQALYEALRVTQAETIRGGRRWWEFYNPVNGRGEGSKTYIGTEALLLGTLYDFS